MKIRFSPALAVFLIAASAGVLNATSMNAPDCPSRRDIRNKLENDRYYENFVAVAKWCERQERWEKAWTRVKRSTGTAPRCLRRIASKLWSGQ
jgi:hypothetical protein